MTKSKLFIAAIAISTSLASPAFAQWQSQEPAAFAAQYPNGDHSVTLGGVRDALAFVPMTRPPHITMMRGHKGK